MNNETLKILQLITDIGLSEKKKNNYQKMISKLQEQIFKNERRFEDMLENHYLNQDKFKKNQAWLKILKLIEESDHN